ncbi:substrate-binding periplasmic protein [Aeromonas sanarellii]|uniref:substrate-binding periplasmic protein n=1 Tax=Aeromonas sanarellii TaxID=633415 RepID=UPI003BA1F5B3
MLRQQCKALLLFICLGSQVCATELKIVFSQYTPPYVLEDGSGILVDIVRTALAEEGYQVTPVYVPIERGFRMFADRQVDGTTIIQERSGLQADYSDDFMQYHNRAFVLKSSQQVIHSVADLGGKSVVAFQYANRYLGEAFSRAVAGNPRYKELAQQQSQVYMLLLGRADVAVMDESIFRYYRQKLIAEHKVEPGQEVIGYDIFPPTRAKAAFINPAVRDSFDKAIARMRKDGRFEAIYRKYIDRYFPVEP